MFKEEKFGQCDSSSDSSIQDGSVNGDFSIIGGIENVKKNPARLAKSLKKKQNHPERNLGTNGWKYLYKTLVKDKLEKKENKTIALKDVELRIESYFSGFKGDYDTVKKNILVGNYKLKNLFMAKKMKNNQSEFIPKHLEKFSKKGVAELKKPPIKFQKSTINLSRKKLSSLKTIEYSRLKNKDSELNPNSERRKKAQGFYHLEGKNFATIKTDDMNLQRKITVPKKMPNSKKS